MAAIISWSEVLELIPCWQEKGAPFDKTISGVRRQWLCWAMSSEKDSLMEKLKMLPAKLSRSNTPQRSPNKSPNKTPKNRHRTYSVVSLSEVTEGSLQVWRALPEKIRQDPSLASFAQEHCRRVHGELFNPCSS